MKSILYIITLSTSLVAFICLPHKIHAREDFVMAIVDIESILLNSNAAHLGREHIKQVRARLEQGYNDLIKTLASLPEEKRNKEMQEAAQALNQQLELEKRAVNQVVNQLMLEEIRTYRINHKLAMVLPKQLALDVDAQYEITDQIIKAMNEKQPVFGKLPVVQVKK